MSKTGEQIKKRKKQLGMSADELAEKLGVSRSTIFRYEYTAFNHALEHISKSTLMIKGKDFIHRVEFQNIEYIESRNKYIIIHCTCGIVYTERCKLSDIEELLDSRFLRCHQSYIINMDEVKEINTSFLMFSGNTVPIRRKDFAKIRNKFEEYTTFK